MCNPGIAASEFEDDERETRHFAGPADFSKDVGSRVSDFERDCKSMQ